MTRKRSKIGCWLTAVMAASWPGDRGSAAGGGCREARGLAAAFGDKR